MARVQPSLTKNESDLIDQVSALMETKRTDVLRNALAVYHWFVTYSIIGARILARKPSGEEVELQTPELAAVSSKGQRLEPSELALLAETLSKAKDPKEAAILREQITRGFYGI
jgi:hypothetical protein